MKLMMKFVLWRSCSVVSVSVFACVVLLLSCLLLKMKIIQMMSDVMVLMVRSMVRSWSTSD